MKQKLEKGEGMDSACSAYIISCRVDETCTGQFSVAKPSNTRYLFMFTRIP